MRDPWVTGWAAAAGLALLCAGLFLQAIAGSQQVTDNELARDMLEYAFDSVVAELDSVRAGCEGE